MAELIHIEEIMRRENARSRIELLAFACEYIIIVAY